MLEEKRGDFGCQTMDFKRETVPPDPDRKPQKDRCKQEVMQDSPKSVSRSQKTLNSLLGGGVRKLGKCKSVQILGPNT